MLDVIIPVFNRAHTIEATLKSIFNSTYKDFRVTVVDDASTDNLREVLLGYDLNFIRRDINSGTPGICTHTGIETTGGSHITVVDSDDTIRRDGFELLMEEFEKDPTLDLVYSNRINIEDGERWVQHAASCIPYSKETMLKWNCISQLCIYTRDLYNSVGGFDPQFKRSEDYELYIRMSKIAKVKKIPQNLYFCNRRSSHASIILNEYDRVRVYEDLAREKNR